MNEVDSNKLAWNLLAKDHYEHFKERLKNESSILNPIIHEELGDLKGKTLIHLQCNTGADTVSLARNGAIITGVDIAPDNVLYAKKLAQDFGFDQARFIESDIMKLKEIHQEHYDIVFTS